MIELPESLNEKYSEFFRGKGILPGNDNSPSSHLQHLKVVSEMRERDRAIRSKSQLYKAFGENALNFFKPDGSLIFTVHLLDMKFLFDSVSKFNEMSTYLVETSKDVVDRAFWKVALTEYEEFIEEVNRIVEASPDDFAAETSASSLDVEGNFVGEYKYFGDRYRVKTSKNRDVYDVFMQLGVVAMTRGYCNIPGQQKQATIQPIAE